MDYTALDAALLFAAAVVAVVGCFDTYDHANERSRVNDTFINDYDDYMWFDCIIILIATT
jgi:hypothetical protein